MRWFTDEQLAKHNSDVALRERLRLAIMARETWEPDGWAFARFIVQSDPPIKPEDAERVALTPSERHQYLAIILPP